MRSLLIFLAAVVLIILGLWTTLVLYFDEERLKQIATEQVRAQTGREFSIDGDLELDFFPGISIVARDVTLSGPDDYVGPDLFTADEFRMSVSLLPLLSGNVETGDIALDRAEVNVHTDASGRGSLSGLVNRVQSAPEASSARGDVSTERISFRDIRLVLSDEASDSRQVFVVETLNVDAFRYDRPVPFDFAGSIGDPALVTGIELEGEVIVPSGDGPIQITRLQLAGNASGLAFGLTGSADIQPGPPVVARFADGELELGEDRFTTAFTLVDGDRPRIEASLEGPMLDFDALLPEAAATSDSEEVAGAGKASAESSLLVLREFDLDARLSLEAMKVSGLTLRSVEGRVESVDGLLAVDPLTAQLDGGRFDAVAMVDLNVQPAEVRVSPAFDLQSVGDALSPWGLDRYLSGAGGIRLQLTARGLTADEVLRTLDGEGDYDLRDGALQGLDLNAMVAELEGSNAAAAVRAGLGGRTEFETLAGLIDIEDGTIGLPGMRLITERLGVTGDVRIGLANLGLDGTLRFQSDRLGEIPVELGGSLSAPQLAPDIGEALKREAGRRVLDLLRERTERNPENESAGGEIEGGG